MLREERLTEDEKKRLNDMVKNLLILIAETTKAHTSDPINHRIVFDETIMLVVTELLEKGVNASNYAIQRLAESMGLRG